MRGRMLHDEHGHTSLTPYGRTPTEVIHSISRPGLNMLLMDAAEAAGARILFQQRCARHGFRQFRADIQRPIRQAVTHVNAAHRNRHGWRRISSTPGDDKAAGCESGGRHPAPWLQGTHHPRRCRRPPPDGEATPCTSGHGAVTCSSPCRTWMAASQSPCSWPGKATPVSPTSINPAALQAFFATEFPRCPGTIPDLERNFLPTPPASWARCTVRAGM